MDTNLDPDPLDESGSGSVRQMYGSAVCRIRTNMSRIRNTGFFLFRCVFRFNFLKILLFIEIGESRFFLLFCALSNCTYM
jgi:hypothetical protein